MFNGSTKNNKIYTGIKPQLQYSLGCYQTPIQKNAHFTNDDTVMYLCGNHIVLYDIVTKKQQFIMKDIEDQETNCINKYYNQNNEELYVAVGLISNQKILPQAKIYKSKKQGCHVLVHSHLQLGYQIKDLCFLLKKDMWSYEPKDIMIDVVTDFYDQINEPIVDACMLEEYPFLFVVTESNKIYTFKKEKLLDINEIELISTDTFESPFQKKQNQTQEEIQQLQKLLEKTKVSCISKTQSGIILGFSGQGMIGVYELQQGDKLAHKGNFYLQSEEIINRIDNIEVASDDMYAVLTVVFEPKGTAAAQKFGAPDLLKQKTDQQIQGKLEHFIFDLGQIEALKQVQKNPFESIFEKGIHTDSITGIAMTDWRNIFCSISNDKHVKFWEYPAQTVGPNLEFKSLINQYFHDPPLSVAIHPTSVQCAIGFKDSLKFYYLGYNQIKNVASLSQKQCSALSYSSGGQLLATANFNAINIYNPYNFQLVQVLSGHSVQIIHLKWINIDPRVDQNNGGILHQQLQSTAINGQLYVWNLNKQDQQIDLPYLKEVEHPAPTKNFKYLYVTYDYTYDRIIAACDDKKVRVYPKVNMQKNGKNNFTYDGMESELDQYFEYDTSPLQFTCIHINESYKQIIFGTDVGSVRIFFWPFFQRSVKQIEFIEVPIHQNVVSSIQITPDDKYMITASQDNSIFISKLICYWEGDEQEISNYQDNYSDEQIIFYLLQDIGISSKIANESLSEQIKELQYRVQNFTTDIEDEKERRHDIYSQKLDTLYEKHRDTKNKQREQLAQTFNDHEAKYNELKEKLANIKYQSKKTIDQMNQKNSKQLLICYQRNDELNQDKEFLMNKYKNQISDCLKMYNSTLKKVEEEYQDKYRQLQEKYSEALNSMDKDGKKFELVTKQSEEDQALFLRKKEDQLKFKIHEQEQITDNLRADNSQKLKQIQSLKERKIFLTGLINDTKNENNNLQVELDKQKKLIIAQQLGEKEEIINQRESQIKDYRLKNIHLLNFQKVYDYRMNTLQEERQPLIDHLSNMEKHVKNLYKELLDEASQNKQFDQDCENQEKSIEELKTVLNSKKKLVQETKNLLESFKHKIVDLLRNKQFNEWDNTMEKIYLEQFEEKQKRLDKILDSSMIGANLKQKDPLLIQIEKIQQEEVEIFLREQRDYFQKKLNVVNQDYALEMEDRGNALLRELTSFNKNLSIDPQDIYDDQQLQSSEIENISHNISQISQIQSDKRRSYKETQQTQIQNQKSQDIKLQQQSQNLKKKAAVKPLPFQNFEKKQSRIKEALYKSENQHNKFYSLNKEDIIKMNQTSLNYMPKLPSQQNRKIANQFGGVVLENNLVHGQGLQQRQVQQQKQHFLKQQLQELQNKNQNQNQYKNKQQQNQNQNQNQNQKYIAIDSAEFDSNVKGANLNLQLPNSRSTKLTTQTNFNLQGSRSNWANSRGNNISTRGKNILGSTMGSNFAKTGNYFRIQNQNQNQNN
ncbi:WD40-repeat-containing domain [Pseudocohnilembus persalinus]|uniref:WD40-repeat-containing domain n=1 Tax=Pseudocohnilembus persalinus TaxID=266149 RepID=A0A0V0QD10_PSEPJ|nr:WD40-repeat-containing domain [Pseudocohnilembus persalinus]|eukprot:KRX00028.1 WD40-repeat-containing domain [Pseudocohnilembus persalinus]